MAESTIAAISTALGEGGIAIVRVSGSNAVKISTKILKRKNFDIPGKLYLTSLIDDDANVLDQVLAVCFRSPNSYTGEDIVEIHTHGGIFVARLCLELLLKHGATLAQPGEFTRRAFTNGRIDLSQAEGVLGIIKARSLEAVKASARTLGGGLSKAVNDIHKKILNIQANIEINLDFPEGETFDASFDLVSEISRTVSDLEKLLARLENGMIFSNGVSVTIAGRPNVGKSSLLNALLGRERAIVTDIPGTTRDIISETILINSLPVILSDTAGIRQTDNIIEAEGVKLALNSANESDLCLFVVDGSQKISDEEKILIDSLADSSIIVFNKSDLEHVAELDTTLTKIFVSAKNETGIEELKAAIYDKSLRHSATPDGGLNANARQANDIRDALEDMREALSLVMSDSSLMTADIIAGLMNEARVCLLRVMGVEASDELLDYMFNRFCVGK
ncbi:MAG: tRNA uridine-5-carboxymethylaminomethyl(34) synthesis GTPase MnmE [Synergistaceae bacterium]|nr:tRNA uridine-5-carboxymethylaminomethyl(34) synthesis GTPase MnmE [Synergistaceae bacterium]